MSEVFHKVAILGGGLLGGSLAMAVAELGGNACLWARREETVREARDLSIATTADMAEAVAGADLVVLSVPVGAMPDLLEKAIANGLPDVVVVTDVGSVKCAPHRALAPLLQGSGRVFIGSHPMAGSEKNGLSAARVDLFKNAACLVTNDALASESQVAQVEAFWQAVGCHTRRMTAAEHDALVARISHLPHVVAAAAARICLEHAEEGKFGGGGLRDTTRVAGGNPDMWAEILTENRDAIAGPLRRTVEEMQSILAILEAGDQEAARQWLAQAKTLRDALNRPT